MSRETGGPVPVKTAPLARPRRGLGQNFLVDRNISAKIVAALAVSPADTVIEIGPGRGALCPCGLAAAPRRYLCLELDRDLVRSLAKDPSGLIPVNIDALRFDWERAAGALILGNLPYNVASPLIWDICAGGRFSRAVFMVQREVAGRIAAPAGGKVYGALSAFVQAHATAECLFTVGPNVFRPRPKVDSAVIRLTPRPDRPRAAEGRLLSRLLAVCFQQRRKQLQKILRPYWNDGLSAALASLGLNERSRPEEVGPEGFRLLLKNISIADFPLTFA
ncbi:MAG: ribosomal RNA small subunit methyltransferase A [Desulfovibrionaceae bacterium]|nr:ribosomal RNA small subunit methyltransferase A [Desulfovibrionaceae bacterium]